MPVKLRRHHDWHHDSGGRCNGVAGVDRQGWQAGWGIPSAIPRRARTGIRSGVGSGPACTGHLGTRAGCGRTQLRSGARAVGTGLRRAGCRGRQPARPAGSFRCDRAPAAAGDFARSALPGVPEDAELAAGFAGASGRGVRHRKPVAVPGARPAIASGVDHGAAPVHGRADPGRAGGGRGRPAWGGRGAGAAVPEADVATGPGLLRPGPGRAGAECAPRGARRHAAAPGPCRIA